MDEECEFCHVPIEAIKPRFYVSYSGLDQKRDEWTVILTLCPKCFCGFNIHAVLKFAAAGSVEGR